MVMHKTSISPMMVPKQYSVIFYYKTNTWSCLSWTTCSHVCSTTSSCFGACYRSSYPENPATSSRRFVLQTFFSDMLSLKYHITNRIWISGRYDGWNIPSIHILFPACIAIVPISHGFPFLSNYYLGSSTNVVLPWVPSISDDKQKSSIVLSSTR